MEIATVILDSSHVHEMIRAALEETGAVPWAYVLNSLHESVFHDVVHGGIHYAERSLEDSLMSYGSDHHYVTIIHSRNIVKEVVISLRSVTNGRNVFGVDFLSGDEVIVHIDPNPKHKNVLHYPRLSNCEIPDDKLGVPLWMLELLR